MTKETIELERDPNHLKNYNRMDERGTEDQFTLDVLLEWSQQPDNLNKKVYRHKVRRSEENIGRIDRYWHYGVVITKEQFEEPRPSGADPQGWYTTNYCDLVYYLDIYWQ